MAWSEDIYYYKIGTLKAIACNYEYLYSDAHQAELFMVAETKADFDMALSAIGKGNWQGITSRNFGDYKAFGRRQRVIIATILEISDRKLMTWGFKDPKTLRSRSYHEMLAVLNVGQRKFRESATFENDQS